MADSIERIQDQPIIEEMQDSYLTYAMSVIMARALPDARDGLKPSQRRILVAMHDLNLGPRSAHRKCAKIAGDTSGNYHPHGEQVVYPTLVRMAQDWNMRHVLVDGQGNFGSIDGDPPAAMRYTEARLAAPAVEMLQDLQLDTVDFEDNYDGTRQEPVVLPSKFPNLLVNGSTGIAVGMSTNVPPHNLSEVCDAVIAYLDNPQISVQELMQRIPGPDFPTGGIICGRAGIVEAYRTGHGTITVRGKVHTEELRGSRRAVVVDEIPYMILKNTIAERIAGAVKAGAITDVADVRDESGRKHDVRIVLELKKDGNDDLVINQLYKYTPLQSNFTIINIALVGRQPQVMGLRELIAQFVDHRREVIRRRTAHLLHKARQRAHVVEGLILAVGEIDAIIALIKGSADPGAARGSLKARPLRLSEHEMLRRLLPAAFVERATSSDHHLTDAQAEAILAMQLQRLTGLEIEKLAREYVKLTEEIKGYEAVLGDERLVLDIIREDLYELKEKHGDERRTEITGAVSELSMEELVPDEQVVVTISHQGYVKRVPVDAYRRQGRGGKGVRGGETREGDFLEHLFVCSTHDFLLVFTNRGRVYWLRVYDLPSMQRTSRGRSLANLLSMQPSEEQRAVLPVSRFEERFVFFATAKGVVKKTPLGAFSRPRPSGIIALSVDLDDELINVELTGGADEIVMGSRQGMAVRFNEDDVRAMGRSARGVRGMTLRGDDRVVDMVMIRPGMSLLTVCEKGFAKRTDIEEYRLTRRGGKGVINVKVTDKNGPVVALRPVTGTDELMVITAQGKMLRTGLEDVREIGRATQGVRFIRVDEGDAVVAVARIVVEEEENEDRPDAEPPSKPGDDAAQAPPTVLSDTDTQPEGPSGDEVTGPAPDDE